MKRLAWLLAAASIAAVVAAGVIAADHDRPLGEIVSIATVFAVCFPVMGALVIRRQGSHPVGWLMIFIGTTVSLHTLVDNWSRAAILWEPGSLPGGVFLAWIALWLWLPGWFLSTTLLLLWLPDGRPQGRRLTLARASIAVVVLSTVLNAILGWPLRGLIDDSQTPPPDLETEQTLLTATFVPEALAIITFTLLALASLIRRYRREHDPRLAWVIYGGALAAVFGAIGAFPAVPDIVQTLQAVAIVGGIGVAMLRHNLYDIGVVVNRTLVYGGLTAILAGAYLVSVLLLQLLLSPTNDLAIAASTLAVAALFQPVRNRVQAFVDRRFYRRKYDAQRTLDAFAARLRNEIELDTMEAELRTVIIATMQPEHVTLWVRP